MYGYDIQHEWYEYEVVRYKEVKSEEQPPSLELLIYKERKLGSA